MKKNISKIFISTIFICAIALNFSLSRNLHNNRSTLTLEGQKANALSVCEELYLGGLVCCESGGSSCNALGYQLNGPFYY